jgi:hypothetical protein
MFILATNISIQRDRPQLLRCSIDCSTHFRHKKHKSGHGTPSPSTRSWSRHRQPVRPRPPTSRPGAQRPQLSRKVVQLGALKITYTIISTCASISNRHTHHRMSDGGFELKVHIEPLNNTNWGTWSFLMEQYLIVDGLWDIVSGVETEPVEISKRDDFLRRQKSARAQIALHISPSQFNTVRFNTDPKRIWEELQQLNRLRGSSTRMALRRELLNMKKDPEMPMSTWITSVRDVAQRIKDLKGDVPDEGIMAVLMNSLPESYAPLVIQLDAMEESARTLSHVITRLIAEEWRQKDRGDAPIAPKRRRRDRSDITCFECGGKGHFRSECSKKRERVEAPRLSFY